MDLRRTANGHERVTEGRKVGGATRDGIGSRPASDSDITIGIKL